MRSKARNVEHRFGQIFMSEEPLGFIIMRFLIQGKKARVIQNCWCRQFFQRSWIISSCSEWIVQIYSPSCLGQETANKLSIFKSSCHLSTTHYGGFTRYFSAARQAGKLWIPIFVVFEQKSLSFRKHMLYHNPKLLNGPWKKARSDLRNNVNKRNKSHIK